MLFELRNSYFIHIYMPVPTFSQANLDKVIQKIFYPKTEDESKLFKMICERFYYHSTRGDKAATHSTNAVTHVLSNNQQTLKDSLKELNIPEEEEGEILDFIKNKVYITTVQPHISERHYYNSGGSYTTPVFRSDFVKKSLEGNIANFNGVRDQDSITFPIVYFSGVNAKKDCVDFHKKYPTSKLLSVEYNRLAPSIGSSDYKSGYMMDRSKAVECALAIDDAKKASALMVALDNIDNLKDISSIFDAVSRVNGSPEEESISENDIARRREIAKKSNEVVNYLESLFNRYDKKIDINQVNESLDFANKWSKKVEIAFSTLKGASEDRFKNAEFSSLSESDIIDFFSKTENAKLFSASLDVLRAPDFIKKCDKAKETLDFIKNSSRNGDLANALNTFKEHRAFQVALNNDGKLSPSSLKTVHQQIDKSLENLDKDDFFSFNKIDSKIAEIEQLSDIISNLGIINSIDEEEKESKLNSARNRIDEISTELNEFLKSFLDRSSDKFKDMKPESLTSDEIKEVLSEDSNPKAFEGAKLTQKLIKTISTGAKCYQVMETLNSSDADDIAESHFSWGQDVASQRVSKAKSHLQELLKNVSLDSQVDDEKFKAADKWIDKSNRKLISSLTSFVPHSSEEFKKEEFTSRIEEMSGDEIISGMLNKDKNAPLFDVIARYGADIFGKKLDPKLFPTSHSKHLTSGIINGQSSFLSGDSASGKTESLKVANRKIKDSLQKMDRKDAEIMESQTNEAKVRTGVIESVKADIEAIRKRQAERDQEEASKSEDVIEKDKDGNDIKKNTEASPAVSTKKMTPEEEKAAEEAAKAAETAKAEENAKIAAEKEADINKIKELEEKAVNLTKEDEEIKKREKEEWLSKGVDGELKPRQLKIISIDHRTTDTQLEKYYEELVASKANMNSKRDVMSVFVDESDLILNASTINLVRNKIMKFCEDNGISVVKSTASIPLPELVNDCKEYMSKIQDFVSEHEELPESIKQIWSTMKPMPPIHTAAANHYMSKASPNEIGVDFSRLRTCTDSERIQIIRPINKSIAQAAEEMTDIKNKAKKTMDAINDLPIGTPERNKMAFACSELFTELTFVLKKSLETVLSREDIKKLKKNLDNQLLPSGSGLSAIDVPVFSMLNAENRLYKGFDEVRGIIEGDMKRRNASEPVPLAIQQLFSDDEIKEHFGSAHDIGVMLNESLNRIQQTPGLESNFKELSGDSNQIYNLVVTDELGKKHPYNISISVSSKGKINISVSDISRSAGDNFYLGKNNTIFVTSNKRESYISQDPVTNILVNCPDPQNQQNGRNRRFQQVSIMVSDEDKIEEEIGYEAFLMMKFKGFKPDREIEEVVEDLCGALDIGSGRRYDKILEHAKHFVNTKGGAELYIDGYLGESLSVSKEKTQMEEASFQSSVESCAKNIENAKKYMAKNPVSFLNAQKYLKQCRDISEEIATLRHDFEIGQSIYNAASLNREIQTRDKARRVALKESVKNIGIFMNQSDRAIVSEIENIYQEAKESRMSGKSLPFEVFKLKHNLVTLKQIDDSSKSLMEELQNTSDSRRTDLINIRLEDLSARKEALFKTMEANKKDYITQSKENAEIRSIVSRTSDVYERGLTEGVSSAELFALNNALIKIRILMENESICNIDMMKRTEESSKNKPIPAKYINRLSQIRKDIKEISEQLPQMSNDLITRSQKEKECLEWVNAAKMKLSAAMKSTNGIDDKSIESMVQHCRHNLEQSVRSVNAIHQYGEKFKEHIEKYGSIDSDHKFIEKQLFETKIESQNRDSYREHFDREMTRLVNSITSQNIQYNPNEPAAAGTIKQEIIEAKPINLKFTNRNSSVPNEFKFENLNFRKPNESEDLEKSYDEPDLSEEERFAALNAFVDSLYESSNEKITSYNNGNNKSARIAESINSDIEFVKRWYKTLKGPRQINDEIIKNFIESIVPENVKNIMSLLGDKPEALKNMFKSLNAECLAKMGESISALDESIIVNDKDIGDLTRLYNKNVELFQLTHDFENFKELNSMELFSNGALKKGENNAKLLSEAIADVNDLNKMASTNNRKISDTDVWKDLKDSSFEANLAKVMLKSYRAAAENPAKKEQAEYIKLHLDEISSIAKNSFIRNMNEAELHNDKIHSSSNNTYLEAKNWYDILDMISQVSQSIDVDTDRSNVKHSTPEDANCLDFVENKIIGKQSILNLPYQAMACAIYVEKEINKNFAALDGDKGYSEEMSYALSDKIDGKALEAEMHAFEKFSNQQIDLKIQEPLKKTQIDVLKENLRKIEISDAKKELTERLESDEQIDVGIMRKLNQDKELTNLDEHGFGATGFGATEFASEDLQSQDYSKPKEEDTESHYKDENVEPSKQNDSSPSDISAPQSSPDSDSIKSENPAATRNVQAESYVAKERRRRFTERAGGQEISVH